MKMVCHKHSTPHSLLLERRPLKAEGSGEYRVGGPFQMKIETKTRTVIDYVIKIDGQSFDAVDLFETLCAVRYGGVTVTNRTMAMMLLKKQVLNSAGSGDRPASKGPKFTSFRKELKHQFEILRGIGYDPPV